MKKKTARNIIIVIILLLLFLVIFFTNISDYKQYIIMVLLICIGLKGVLDFLFGLPMRVGCSGTIPNTKDREFSRTMLLLLGIAMISFGVGWILLKLIQ